MHHMAQKSCHYWKRTVLWCAESMQNSIYLHKILLELRNEERGEGTPKRHLRGARTPNDHSRSMEYNGELNCCRTTKIVRTNM